MSYSVSMSRTTNLNLDDVPFKKIHEGKESLDNCKLLFNNLSNNNKKMEYKHKYPFFGGTPSCILYAYDMSVPNSN